MPPWMALFLSVPMRILYLSLFFSRKGKSSSLTALDSVDSPTHFRPIGKLLHLNADGSQVLELNRPPHGPYGFYIARGNAKYNHGECCTAVCLFGFFLRKSASKLAHRLCVADVPSMERDSWKAKKCCCSWAQRALHSNSLGSLCIFAGIFVSRLSDSLPASFFASLLGVGDEILEINHQEIRTLAMEQIHDMMASNSRLILKTLPFLARRLYNT